MKNALCKKIIQTNTEEQQQDVYFEGQACHTWNLSFLYCFTRQLGFVILYSHSTQLLASCVVYILSLEIWVGCMYEILMIGNGVKNTNREICVGCRLATKVAWYQCQPLQKPAGSD